jgi:hypothetical protein
LVIEKAKVDAEVMRLSRLRAEHQEAQYTLRSRLRVAEQDAARFERHIAGMKQDLSVRRDTHGEKFEIVLKGERFTERVKAGAALIYHVEDHRNDHRLGRNAAVTLGDFAGFKVEFRSTQPEKVTLRGAMEYPANVSPSPAGIISSLEHAARAIDEQLERCRADLERSKRDHVELTALNGKPFEHEARFHELLTRQTELVAALDITKNQASARLSADAADDTAPAAVAAEPDVGERFGAPEAQEPVRSERPTPPELMTPREFRSAGLGPANDTHVLEALRARRPVSAAAVDEYNLKHALPAGYVRDEERFVFRGLLADRAEVAPHERGEAPEVVVPITGTLVRSRGPRAIKMSA